jgi:hypothetical protein
MYYDPDAEMNCPSWSIPMKHCDRSGWHEEVAEESQPDADNKVHFPDQED